MREGHWTRQSPASHGMQTTNNLCGRAYSATGSLIPIVARVEHCTLMTSIFKNFDLH